MGEAAALVKSNQKFQAATKSMKLVITGLFVHHEVAMSIDLRFRDIK
jgi:hypothetical protein